MADYFHKHGGKFCIGTRRHRGCPPNKRHWQVVCGLASPHRCLHLDPAAPGGGRLLKVLKAIGVKVHKGMKPARKRAAKRR